MFKLRDDFRSSSPNIQCQYFSIYNDRLNQLKPQLMSAISPWMNKDNAPPLVERVLDVANTLCIAFGTIHKETPNQPSVLAEFDVESARIKEIKTSLEDTSGSVNLRFEDPSLPSKLVSGVPVAVLGYEADSGEHFVVTDIKLPGPPASHGPCPSIPSTSIVLVSDLALNDTDCPLAAVHVLADFLAGVSPHLSSTLHLPPSRFIVSGGLFYSSSHDGNDSGLITSFKQGNHTLSLDWLSKLLDSTSTEVDLIPGPYDPCPCSLPQPPLL
ncbi:hypothetical protein GEMRC1_006999 [Eukaryota sp. GEM-RC1]